MHAALFATLAVDRVNRAAGLDIRHHGALAWNDPEEHIRTHGRCNHGADQQKCRAPGKPMASQVSSQYHQQRHQCADDGVAIRAIAKDTANRVIR